MKSELYSRPQADRATSRAAQNMPALALLTLSAALIAAWACVRNMWNDEIETFLLDSLPSVRQILHTQLTSPITLEPPTYHLLSHAAMWLVGRTAFGLRLPAAAGFVLMQACLFLFVRRMATYSAAVLCMMLPLCTVLAHYSVEGRPYGLMLGTYMLAIYCWYIASIRGSEQPPRWQSTLALIGLAVAIALTTTMHFFGVLVVVPIAAGELTRFAKTRRIDWPVALAVIIGASTALLDIPFLQGLAPYRHSNLPSTLTVKTFLPVYSSLFLNITTARPWVQTIAGLLFLAIIVALVGTITRQRAKRIDTAPAHGWACVSTLAALPIVEMIFSALGPKFSHIKYVLPAPLGILIAVSIVLSHSLKARAFRALQVAVLLCAVALYGMHTLKQRSVSQAELRGLTVSPALRNELATHPDERLYIEDIDRFYVTTFYAPDPLIRSRITYLYDHANEIRWEGHDSYAITGEQLPNFTPLQIEPWNNVRKQRSPLVIVYGTSLEWIGSEIEDKHISVEPLGTELGGHLLRLSPPAR